MNGFQRFVLVCMGVILLLVAALQAMDDMGSAWLALATFIAGTGAIVLAAQSRAA